MTRPLLIVGACAILVAFFCFIAASALGSFNLPLGEWNPSSGRGPTVDGGGPHITRTIDWSGEDEFEVNVPADVTFTQGPEAKLEISGPTGTVNAIELEGDSLQFRQRVRDPDDIVVHLTAPDVQRFEINGAGKLTLEKYDQDRLEVHLRGAGEVSGAGRAREVEVHMAGAGEADLGAVQAESAEVHIAGAGEATVSPTRRIEVHVAGAGDVKVTTRPPEVESHVAGAGGIKFTEPVLPPTPEPPAAREPPPSTSKSAI
jgi:hypothetical protein